MKKCGNFQVRRGTAVSVVTDVEAARRLKTTKSDIHALLESGELSGYFASWGVRVQTSGPRSLEAWETELGLG